MNMVAIDGFRRLYKNCYGKRCRKRLLGDVAIVILKKPLKEINSIIGESDDKIIINAPIKT